MRRRALALLTAAVACPAAKAAPPIPQTAATAPMASTVSGRVTDPTGAVIPGATVILQAAGVAPRRVTSDSGGRYTFTAVPAGTYTVTASAQGFATATKPNVVVNSRRLSLDMSLAIEAMQQTVQVRPGSSDTSPAHNGDSIVLKGSDLDMLSTDSGMMQQELQAMAATGGDGSAQMYVDGFSGGKMPPKNTIREIRINNNPFSAEYEEEGFNRIEIFTKPGTDKLHGEAYGFGTTSGLDSKNPYAPEPQPFYQAEMDGDLEGPVGKKTSFLAGILLRRQGNSAIVNAEGLNAENQQTTLTDAVPNPTDVIGASLKIDRQVSTNNTLTARVDSRTTNETNTGVGQLVLASEGYSSDMNYTTLQIADSQIFGTKVINDAHFQYQRSRSSESPVSTAPAVIVQGAFSGGGSDLGHVTDNQDAYELQDFATFDLGKHFVRTGVRTRLNRDANSSTANYNGEYIFSSLDAYQITEQGLAAGESGAAIRAAGGGASQFNITTGQPSATVLLEDTALFAEDTWKLTKNLTTSYGLRFETQNHTADQADFAPRVAATYNIGAHAQKPPMLVMQTGFGIFYTRFPSADLLEVQRQNGVSQLQYVLTSPDTYPTIPPLSELAAGSAAPTVYRLSPTYHSPYSLASNVSLQHTFGESSLTFGYSASRGVHLLLSTNINAPLPGTYNIDNPESGVRPFGTNQNIYQYGTQGISNENHLYVNGRIRHGKALMIFLNYNFGYSRTDTNGSFPSNQYDVGADYGRATNDARQRLFLGGFSELPHGVETGLFMIAQSGTPFDIVVGQDLNGDNQFNDRPSFATDLSRASVVHTKYGIFDTDPIAGQTIIPNNYGQGPGIFLLNTFVEKDFSFGSIVKPPADAPAPKLKPGQKPPPPERRFNMFGVVEADNVLNHVNPAPPVGTLGSPLFGISNALNGSYSQGSANRQIEFVVGFHF